MLLEKICQKAIFFAWAEVYHRCKRILCDENPGPVTDYAGNFTPVSISMGPCPGALHTRSGRVT